MTNTEKCETIVRKLIEVSEQFGEVKIGLNRLMAASKPMSFDEKVDRLYRIVIEDRIQYW